MALSAVSCSCRRRHSRRCHQRCRRGWRRSHRQEGQGRRQPLCLQGCRPGRQQTAARHARPIAGRCRWCLRLRVLAEPVTPAATARSHQVAAVVRLEWFPIPGVFLRTRRKHARCLRHHPTAQSHQPELPPVARVRNRQVLAAACADKPWANPVATTQSTGCGAIAVPAAPAKADGLPCRFAAQWRPVPVSLAAYFRSPIP